MNDSPGRPLLQWNRTTNANCLAMPLTRARCGIFASAAPIRSQNARGHVAIRRNLGMPHIHRKLSQFSIGNRRNGVGRSPRPAHRLGRRCNTRALGPAHAQVETVGTFGDWQLECDIPPGAQSEQCWLIRPCRPQTGRHWPGRYRRQNSRSAGATDPGHRAARSPLAIQPRADD